MDLIPKISYQQNKHLLGSLEQNSVLRKGTPVFKNRITSIELKSGFDKLSLIKQICESKKIKLKINNFDYRLFSIKQYSKNKIKKLAYAKITSKKHQNRVKQYTDSNFFRFKSDNYTIIT